MVVQNTTDKATAVDVVVQAANLDIELAGKQVTVPADDRVEVRFPMSTAAVGTGRLRVAAVSDDPAAPAADAATVDLPVYTPSTSETFAGYGVIDSDTTIEQPLLTPTGVIPEFGGLQVTTSSTALANLTDAVLYLTDYPYESSDGLASQVLAIATLGEVLQAFQAPGLPSPEKLTAAATDKIAQLVAMQNEDGGSAVLAEGPGNRAVQLRAGHPGAGGRGDAGLHRAEGHPHQGNGLPEGHPLPPAGGDESSRTRTPSSPPR